MKLTTLLESTFDADTISPTFDADTISQRMLDEMFDDYEHDVSGLQVMIDGKWLYSVVKRIFSEMFDDLQRLNKLLGNELDADELDMDTADSDVETFLYDRETRMIYIEYFVSLYDRDGNSTSGALRFKVRPSQPKDQQVITSIPRLGNFINLLRYAKRIDQGY